MAKKLKTDSVIAVTEPAELVGLVTVIATSKAQYLKPQMEYKVDAKLAETLIKKGSVTLKK